MSMPTWPAADGPDPYGVPTQDAAAGADAPPQVPPAPPYGAPAPSGYEAVGPVAPAHYGAPAYGTPAYGAPAYGTPGYGTPAYGTPGYGTPAYGAPAYGAPGYGGAPGYAYGPPVWPQATPATDGMAIGAFATSMSALVIGVSAPVGAILGIVALRRIKRTGAGGKGFAIAAIAVGGAITVLGALYVALMVALFTSPGFWDAAADSWYEDGGTSEGTSDGTWDGTGDVGGTDPAAAYRSGDCLALPVYGFMEEAAEVDCLTPHGAEVVGGLEWSPDAGVAYDYDALENELWEHCAEIAYGLAPEEYDAGLLWVDVAVPSQALWDSGFARGTCLVASDEPDLTGSAYLGTLVVHEQGV